MARQNSNSTSWLPVALVPDLVDSGLATAAAGDRFGIAAMPPGVNTVFSESSSSDRPSSARLSAAPNSFAVWYRVSTCFESALLTTLSNNGEIVLLIDEGTGG